MARRKPITREMPDAVREAVDRTVQATIGSAQLGRGRAQEAVDELVRGAEAGAGAVRERVRGALEAGRPATSEEVRELHSELRRISRRLTTIERLLEPAGDEIAATAGRGGAGATGSRREGSSAAGRAAGGGRGGKGARAGSGLGPRSGGGAGSGRAKGSGGARGSS